MILCFTRMKLFEVIFLCNFMEIHSTYITTILLHTNRYNGKTTFHSTLKEEKTLKRNFRFLTTFSKKKKTVTEWNNKQWKFEWSFSIIMLNKMNISSIFSKLPFVAASHYYFLGNVIYASHIEWKVIIRFSHQCSHQLPD